MNSWEAEQQRWDRSAELNHRHRRAKALERRLRITAVVLAALAAATIGGRYLVGLGQVHSLVTCPVERLCR